MVKLEKKLFYFDLNSKLIQWKLCVLACIFFLGTMNLKGQVVLDFTIHDTFYGYLFFPTKISANETKYVQLDTINDKFSLLNLDLSPFLANISVPHPLRFGDDINQRFYHVMYVTRSLFDCDTSNIEFMFSAQSDPGFPFWILRTDGTVLFTSDSTRGPYCLGCPGGTNMLRPILETETGTKMVLMKDLYNSAGSRDISIYSLCGSLPVEVYSFGEQEDLFLNIYPNPSGMQLTLDVSLPDNINNYEVVLIDSNAKIIMRKNIAISGNNFSIDVSEFSGGTYYCALQTNNKLIQTKKFVLLK